jgi:hypothetical protein
MLSGDVLPTAGKLITMRSHKRVLKSTFAGTARLAGYDILTQQPQVRRLLGYCPQWDALLELMTCREHLEMYARVKGMTALLTRVTAIINARGAGVPESRVNDVVNGKLKELDLVQVCTKLVYCVHEVHPLFFRSMQTKKLARCLAATSASKWPRSRRVWWQDGTMQAQAVGCYCHDWRAPHHFSRRTFNRNGPGGKAFHVRCLSFATPLLVTFMPLCVQVGCYCTHSYAAQDMLHHFDDALYGGKVTCLCFTCNIS